MITIDLRGVDEYLSVLAPLESVEILRDPMQRGLYRLQGGMATYPQQGSGSTYRRTGTLGRRWTNAIPAIAATMQGLQGRIGNNTVYGPLVQSHAHQARVHRGRWQTDEMVMQRELPAIQGDFEDAIRRAAEGRR